MVRVLGSGSSGPGSGPGRGHCVVFLGEMLGVTLRWTSIPSRGKYKYSKSLHANETGDKCRPNEPPSS